ncbi:arsenate reductase/protein-tyrosine-phosphatase family protein [Microbacterium forte]
MSEGVRGSLLVVCAANVCRSPFAAFLLGRELPGADVSSAGVTARAGDPLCRFTEERIAAFAGNADLVKEHVATRLDVNSVDRADLILTASEAERSAVAMLAPEARPKTFTLVEAAHGARSVSPLAVDTSFGELAVRMHAQRGLVDLPEARRRHRFSPLRSSYGIAIPDAHIGETRKHDEVYRAVTEAVMMFAGAWAGARHVETSD